MDKYPTYARSRMPGRNERLGPSRRDSSTLATARQAAARFVAAHWPALANVEPEVRLQHEGQRPSPELMARLGLSESEIRAQHTSTLYTFTFASQSTTTDGAIAPLVAAVTVDSQQRVVKTSLSK